MGAENMKANTRVSLTAMVGLLMISACSSSVPTATNTTFAGPQLFSVKPTPERSVLQNTADGYLATLLADPAHKEIILVDANPALVTDTTQELAVTLPGGKTASFHLRDFKRINADYHGWVGYRASDWKQQHPSSEEIDFDPGYYLSIVRHGSQLVGELQVEGQRYQLANIGGDKHVLIEVDESKLPSEDLDVTDQAKALPLPSAHQQPQSSGSTIRLLFVTTNQARIKYPNYPADLMLGLQNLNQTTKNSQIDITYELAGIMNVNYDETGKSFGYMLNSVQYFMPDVARVRDQVHAHLVSMLVASNELCGAGKPGLTKRYGFSAISCISSLAHEIGHNFGLNHHWNGTSVGYNNGYRHEPASGIRFRTQMAYECSPACPRVSFYSTPRLSYQGQPLGTVAHHDAARAINERRHIIESYYPPTLKAIRVTVYDNLNMQGSHCSFEIPATQRVTMIGEECGAPWQFRVWSAKVENITPGTVLRLGNSNAWHTYTSQFYGGDFDVPSLFYTGHEVPDGLILKPHSNTLTKLIDRVEIIK